MQTVALAAPALAKHPPSAPPTCITVANSAVHSQKTCNSATVGCVPPAALSQVCHQD